MSRIDLHIDRLVLTGFDPGDRHAFVQSLRAELARMLANPDTRTALTQSRRTPVLRLGRMPMQPGPGGARTLGSSVAQAIGNNALGRRTKP